MVSRYNDRIQSYNGSLEKGFEEGTCRRPQKFYHQVPETKMFF